LPRAHALVGRSARGEHGPDLLHASGRPVRGSLGIGKLTRHHTVLGLSPDPRGGPLSRHRTRRTVVRSTRSRRAECPGRTRSGPSPRVWSAGTWVFGHWEADPAPYGARTVTRSTRGGAQPTLYPKNRCHKRLGRRRFGFSNEALGVTVSLRVLAQSDQSTNGRLAHNQVVSGGDIRGLTRAAHPHRGAQKLRSKYDRTASRSSEVASESPVTATVPN
jgi:hypothetical protein